jgi:DNA-binding transcriptional MerR regulator
MNDAGEFGIDELARRAGTTVRNVRLYVERGLLPRPRREGRMAYYRDEHVTRLQLVLRLIGRGYTLGAIKELTDAWDAQRGLGHVLGLEDALAAPFTTEAPVRATIEELVQRFPADQMHATLADAIALGLLVPDGDSFIVTSPTFLEAGTELVASGIPLDAVLNVVRKTRRAANELSDAFVSMFMEYVWEPFVAAGEPEDQLDAVVDAINRQRPLATNVVVAALGQAMQERVDRAMMRSVADAPDTEAG